MGTERLSAMFQAARTEGRAVLLPYLTAGLPSVPDSISLFEAMAEAGADGFEVGIPYSDPLMDGPVIQAAGASALRNGIDLDRALEVVRGVASGTGKPTLVMTYVNPVLRVGEKEFAERVAAAGADGLIVADLPVDESAPIAAAAAEAGLGMVQFAAPTTDDRRLRAVAAAEPAFIYGVADLGVTGERREASSHVTELARRVRGVTRIPLVLGVGISTPEHAAAAAAVADGIIVGSALVRRVLEADTAAEAAQSLHEAVVEFAAAVRG